MNDGKRLIEQSYTITFESSILANACEFVQNAAAEDINNRNKNQICDLLYVVQKFAHKLSGDLRELDSGITCFVKASKPETD
ncbi:MAG: hypothetical protein FWE04_01610 [Oscillospiraceae bacterium]|nr:hypothetical protein [Oscillospiraceae bacterium]